MEITREIAAKVLQTVDAGLVKGMGKPIPGQMCVEAAVCYAMGLPHSDEPTCVSPALRKLKIRLNDSRWSSNEVRSKGMRRLALIQLGSAGALDDREFAKRLAEMVIRKQVPSALRIAASVQKNSNHKAALLSAADKCEKEGTRQSALDAGKAAAAAADAAAAAAADAAAYAAAYAAADAADAAADAAYDAYAAAAAADAAADAADAAYAAYAADDAAAAYAAADARDKILSAFAEDVVQLLISMNVPGAQWLDLAPIEAVAA
jgi:hypothetical protein